ncbi:TonB-dependent receptor family protein [Solimonas variicoloris]|uniref:TonB-dependent receptor family protein n=1 Tax=Solimonas variicoloris TaxID=254408 RepID=UPI000367B16C|nr:TonB-dependent receptor [Solimonas variicoloris]
MSYARAALAAFGFTMSALPAAALAQHAATTPTIAPAASDTEARRAELLRQREAIERELRTLDTTPSAHAEPAAAAEVPARGDGIETVVVTGHSSDPAPAQSATTLTREDFAHVPALNIAEVLTMSPGVSFQPGNGPRDVSISVRGSNNRQTYGVRNIKVFEDGFDVTQPDGLARTDLSDPHAYGAIDVVRGPSSAWFGNYATGGAIDFRSRRGREIGGGEAGLDAGSYGTLNVYALAGDRLDALDYAAFVSNVRGRSATAHTDYLTTTANLSAVWQATARDRLVFKFIDNELDADLSLRLSLEQYRLNPYQRGCGELAADGCASVNLLVNGYTGARQATSAAAAGLGRHDRRTIAGARWEHAFDARTEWRTQLVFDNRDIKQPTSAQSYDGTYPSFNLRSDLTRRHPLFGADAETAGGLFYNYEELNSTVYNVTPDGHATRGGLTQSVNGHHLNAGLRLREQIRFDAHWSLVTGIGGEYTQIEGLSTSYRYAADATPTLQRIDARREFHNLAPELALQYAPDEAWTLHARLAAGYGTPQLGNLFVTPAGVAGNNTRLDSQRNYGLDLGAEWRLGEMLRLSLSGFYELFRDELVSQSAGVSLQSYTFNAPRSEHRGVELGLHAQPLPRALPGLYLSAAYTYDDQIYRDYDERLSAGSYSKVFKRDGKKIPGIQPQVLSARLGYEQQLGALQGLGAYLEYHWRDDFYLDNANLLKAPGYELANLNLHYDRPGAGGGASRFGLYLAVQNLFDKTYIGSAGNLSNSLNAATGEQNGADLLSLAGGSIYAGTPRTYYGGIRVRF